MKRNILRELLNEGKPTIGTRMITTLPQIAEVIGESGLFDYIELLGDYASWTLMDLENFARAVELFPHMSSMMKVDPEPRTFMTIRSLGAGIQNMMFADVYSADEGRECIRAVRPATPEDGGTHGCAMRRNVGYVLECGNEAWAQAQRDVVIGVVIEKVSAMENLEDILSIDGLDMVQFGPCDYAINLGKPGQRDLPEIKRKERDMIELALKKGRHPRVELDNAQQLKELKEYIDMGVRHFSLGEDLSYIYQWCKENGNEIRQLLADSYQ